MTNYIFYSDADREMINQSFSYLDKIIFGNNNIRTRNNFINNFQEIVEEIKILPQGIRGNRINNKIPGICYENERGKLQIEMYGYTNANPSQYQFIKHEGIHEFCHSFINILSKNQKKITKQGIRNKNNLGLIEERDSQTGILTGQCCYGKMFNETMMDIITAMAINKDNPNKSIDTMLQSNYRSWENAQTGYTIFTSMTRLAIAAFSNNGNISYDRLVDNNIGIFNAKTEMRNGTTKYANDFLYGIVFDPLYIEEEYDKYMGEDSYRQLCHRLDKLFIFYLENQNEVDPEIFDTLLMEEAKRIMNELADFLNQKMNYYEQTNSINAADRIKIVSNFNRIWNNLQSEYRAYFSQQEIDEIARRARQKNK